MGARGAEYYGPSEYAGRGVPRGARGAGAGRARGAGEVGMCVRGASEIGMRARDADHRVCAWRE